MAFKRKRSSSGKKPSYARKRVRRAPSKAKANFTKRVKAVIMKTAEPKKLDVMWSNKQYFTAQTPIFTNPFYQIAPGDGRSNREGEEIYLRGLAIRMLFEGNVLADTNMRIMLIWKPEPQNSGLVINYSDIFQGMYSNFLLDQVHDDKSVKIVWSRNLKFSPPATPYKDANGVSINNAVQRSYKFYIPFKSKKFRFAKGGDVGVGMDGCYYLVAITDRTSTSTNSISGLNVSSSLSVYFRDP